MMNFAAMLAKATGGSSFSELWKFTGACLYKNEDSSIENDDSSMILQ